MKVYFTPEEMNSQKCSPGFASGLEIKINRALASLASMPSPAIVHIISIAAPHRTCQPASTKPDIWTLYLQKADHRSPVKQKFTTFRNKSTTTIKKKMLFENSSWWTAEWAGHVMTNLTLHTELELSVVFPQGCLKLAVLCHNMIVWLWRLGGASAAPQLNSRAAVVSGRYGKWVWNDANFFSMLNGIEAI